MLDQSNTPLGLSKMWTADVSDAVGIQGKWKGIAHFPPEIHLPPRIVKQQVQQLKNKQKVDSLSRDSHRTRGLVDLQVAAIEATTNAVVITDQTGTVIWVNPAFEQLTGYSRSEIVGKSTQVLKSGQNPRALYEEMWQTILSGRIWRGELINRRKDGSLYHEEMTITPVREGLGEITHYIAIKLDISGRKQVETTLQLLTDRLSLATAVAKIGVWELDIASNAFTWDATMFEIYGFQPVNPTPYQKWAAAVHPKDLPAVEAILKKAIEEKGQGASEFRIILADGSIRHVGAVGRVALDGCGNVDRLLGTSQDITKRQHSEEQNKMLAQAVESSSELIGMTDSEFRITFVNHALLHALGYSEEKELVGKNIAAIMSPNNPPELFSEIVARTMEGGSWRGECFHLRTNGTDYPTMLNTSVIKDKADRVIGTIGIAQDITERKKAVGQLLRLASIVESSDDAIIGKSVDGTIESWNLGAERIYGYSANEAIGKPISMLCLPGQMDEIPAILEKVRKGENVRAFDAIRLRKDGMQTHVDLSVSPIKDVTGRILGASAIARDINQRVQAEGRSKLWSRVLDQSAEGIFICDPQERILLVNSAFERLTGYSAEEVVGKTPRILQSGRQDRAFYTYMWKSISETGGWRGEMWNRRKNGDVYVEWLSIGTVFDHHGALTYYVGIFSDVTVHKESQDRIAHLAHYDALTDLPNRALLMERLNQLTKPAQRRKTKIAVVFIDLDRFKEVNDSLGHHAGDLLLQTMAKRLSNEVRAEDTVARIGGDEFVVVFQDLHDMPDIAMLAQKLLSCVVKPLTLEGYQLTITASMGISVYPDDATDGDEMLRNADAAMYEAKGAGRNTFHFYTSDLNQRALEILTMENALRRAIEHQEFVLHYQPQVDISSGLVVGAEALIRWNNADMGLVMPGKFISLAEKRGLIVPIGNWVIEEAARQAAIWQNAGICIRIAVNVSAAQFRQQDFVEQLTNSVRKSGITPNHLELELTESIIMRDVETAVETLKGLHEMGFQLSIDDFGTGYSSLNYLRRFAIDKIKIDQSFVRDENAGAIVTTIIELARNLKLKVIAEGVETNEQLETLRKQHCDEAQGYLFSPALESAEFEKLVREWKPKYLEPREIVSQ